MGGVAVKGGNELYCQLRYHGDLGILSNVKEQVHSLETWKGIAAFMAGGVGALSCSF